MENCLYDTKDDGTEKYIYTSLSTSKKSPAKKSESMYSTYVMHKKERRGISTSTARSKRYHINSQNSPPRRISHNRHKKKNASPEKGQEVGTRSCPFLTPEKHYDSTPPHNSSPSPSSSPQSHPPSPSPPPKSAESSSTRKQYHSPTTPP